MEPSTSNQEDLNLDQRAYRFFPTTDYLMQGEQQKHNFNKPNGTRIYYHGQVEHDDFQKKKLADFLEFLKQKDFKYDKNYFNNHMMVLFLSANQYKNEQTLQDIKQHIQFKKKYIRDENGQRIIKYQNDEKVKKLVDNGFFYVCGRDKFFRPTIVFNLPKTDLSDADAALRGIVYVQQEVIQKMFIPGQVQCWNIIFDLSGMGLTDLPVNALKSTLKIISSNYGGRLYRLWMLNSPTTVYFSWKVVKNFLDPVTVDKINIIKKNTDDSLWKIYDKSQIQQKYGGTQPNRTKFFPFKIPRAVIDQSRLVPEAKYKQLLQSGFLKNNAIDPKYVKKQQRKEQKKQQMMMQKSQKQKEVQNEAKVQAQQKKQQVKLAENQDKPNEKESKEEVSQVEKKVQQIQIKQ